MGNLDSGIRDWFLKSQQIACLGNWDQDPETGELWWSDQTYRMFGLSPQQDKMTFEKFLAMVHPEDRLTIEDATKKVLESDEYPYKVEYRITPPYQPERIVYEEAFVERDENGHPLKISGIIQDITERKASELKKAKENINLLLDSVLEGVCGFDFEGCCIFWNQPALDMLGYKNNELMGKKIHELLSFRDTDDQQMDINHFVVSSEVQVGEEIRCDNSIIMKSDGTWFHAECKVVSTRQKELQVWSVLTFLDITEKKKIQEQQLRASQLASLGELAAGMAHEVNNPINGVINYAQVLLNKTPEEDSKRELLERIIREGDRIAKIVSNLLHFSQKDRSNKELVNLKDIVSEPLNLVLTQFEKDGIHLDINISDDLPKIYGNGMQLEQVVINMLSNARHALNEKFPRTAPNKTLHIFSELADNEESLSLVFLDMGCGIPNHHLSKIFNPFFTTKETRLGTGLGLSVSNKIINEHGGKIFIESKVTQYTKIVIEFPIALHDTVS